MGLDFARRISLSTASRRCHTSYASAALRRVLNFTRRTIDDVVNNPIVKNEVLGYYKLHKFINRQIEIRDLERQWNSLA